MCPIVLANGDEHTEIPYSNGATLTENAPEPLKKSKVQYSAPPYSVKPEFLQPDGYPDVSLTIV